MKTIEEEPSNTSKYSPKTNKTSTAKKKKSKRKEGKFKSRKKGKLSTNVTFSGVLLDCKHCSKFFPCKERLTEHVCEKHSDHIAQIKCEYHCKRCSQSLSSQEELQQHWVVCKKNTQLQGGNQSSLIPSEAEENLNLKCIWCNVYFSSQEKLRDHEETHVCSAVAMCPCCSSQVKTPNPNVRSIETQTLAFQSCDMCSEVFETKNELDWHQLKRHQIRPSIVHLGERKPPGRPPIPKKRLTCTVCSKVFKSNAALHTHTRKHAKDATFHCKDCEMTFLEKSELILHKENHQTFACSECGKLFTSLSNLQVHFRWHDKQADDVKLLVKDNTWICHVCGQVYGKKSHLTTHLKRHTGIKSYLCPHCTKGFYTSHNLKIHVWTHTGERPYMCTTEGCFKRFTQKSHLKYHIKTHNKKSTGKEDPVNLEVINAPTNTEECQRQQDVQQFTQPQQVVPPGGAVLSPEGAIQPPAGAILPPEGAIIEAESFNEEEVSTTPHVELQGNMQPEELQLHEWKTKKGLSSETPSGSSEALTEINSLEPASIFITEIHSYSEQKSGVKK